MLNWMEQNLGTIAICVLLVAMVAAILLSMRREKRQGKSPCGGSCAHCTLHGACQEKR